MEHPTDIGFVDPHTERTRCDDDVHLVGEKCPEHASPNAGAQACVIWRGSNTGAEQRSRHELREPARRSVDERRTRSVPYARANHCEAFAIVADPHRQERQIRSIE